MSFTALAKASPASSNIVSRVTSPATPATPAAPTPSSAPSTSALKTSTPQPGTWSHPSLDEIARRQNASVFNGDNINRIVVNASLLVASLYLPDLVYSFTPDVVLSAVTQFDPYTQYTAWICRLLLLLNMFMACSPLFRAKDEIEDIPLTPSQRSLLGLKPCSVPLTPGQQYITPPRYARSSTPRSSSAAAQRPTGGSPLSARAASPSSLDRSTLGQTKAASGSPFSSSPLMQKAIGGASAARRLSYGTASPLDLAGSASGTTLSATPTTGMASGKASVALNSKWLYERGRSSPNGKALFT